MVAVMPRQRTEEPPGLLGQAGVTVSVLVSAINQPSSKVLVPVCLAESLRRAVDELVDQWSSRVAHSTVARPCLPAQTGRVVRIWSADTSARWTH